MSAAKMYTSMNVVDRLTKPIQATSFGEDSMRAFDTSFEGAPHTPNSSSNNRLVMDAATFIGSLQGGGSVRGGGSPAGSVTPVGGGGKSVSGETRKIDKEEFDKFLQRQQLVLQKREQNKQSV